MIPDTKTLQQMTGFSKYSPAYVVTNEDLRNAFKYIPKNAENVLTVAASGDHPMFSTLYGAQHIDTFDISYNAKIIMDIKTSAVKLLEYDEYCNLLIRLFQSKNILSTDNMSKIVSTLPDEDKEYIKKMQNYPIFSQGAKPFVYGTAKPTQMEYKKMQQNIQNNFNFIWSDITFLHKKLNISYDFMHLSNIFDYLDPDKTAQSLIELANKTKPGGYIYFELCPYYRDTAQKILTCRDVISANKTQEWDFFTQKNIKTKKIIMQRTK